MIPKDFKQYWSSKGGRTLVPNKRPIMTVEEMWQLWKPYWHLRFDSDHYGSWPKYVLARYGDKGDYTVGNCRVITNRANTLERDHSKCVDKLKGKVHNPKGISGKIRRVVTPQGEFKDCAEASVAYGMHRSSIWHRVKSPRYPGFQWRNI